MANVTRGQPNWWDERWADACQLRSGAELLVAHQERAAVAGIEGVPYRLQRLSFPGLAVIDDCVFGLAEPGVEELVVSPSERTALAFLKSTDGACGYELFSIEKGIRRLGIGQPFTLQAMLSPPAFSRDERLVVSVTSGERRVWWADEDDEDDWRARSPGGVVTFGFLVVHELDKNRISKHRLEFELPEGWFPDDGEDDRWSAPEGVDFVADDRIEIGLPDGSDVELALPLPEAIRLPTPDSGG